MNEEEFKIFEIKKKIAKSYSYLRKNNDFSFDDFIIIEQDSIINCCYFRFFDKSPLNKEHLITIESNLNFVQIGYSISKEKFIFKFNRNLMNRFEVEQKLNYKMLYSVYVIILMKLKQLIENQIIQEMVNSRVSDILGGERKLITEIKK